MNSNSNNMPKGKTLPSEYEGKSPLHIVQVVISEEAQEPSYKVLCKDASFVIIPLSKFVDIEKKENA